MFKGSFKFTIDAKGRLSLPAKIRRDINPEANNAFVLTRGPLQCIDVYPYDQWKLFEAQLNALNMFDPNQAIVARTFLEEASEDKLDAQNRLLLPKSLMEFAQIDREVFILGMLTKIELWNPEIYTAYKSKQGVPFEEVAQQVMIKK